MTALLRRFALRVLGYTIGTTALWWLTRETTTLWSVESAKLFHRLVGRPAPYLLLEIMHFWWMAPPVQLFVGLTLASSWLTWRRRLGCLMIGLLSLWFIVAMDIIAMSSPYLGPSSARTVLSSILTNGHLIITPIIFWLILVGVPPPALLKPPALPGGHTAQDKKKTLAKAAENQMPPLWPRLLGAVLACLIVPLALYCLASTASSEVIQARRDMAKALVARDDPLSLLNAAILGKTQLETTKREDQMIRYLIGRLCLKNGQEALARKHLFHRSINPKAQTILRRELADRKKAGRR